MLWAMQAGFVKCELFLSALRIRRGNRSNSNVLRHLLEIHGANTEMMSVSGACNRGLGKWFCPQDTSWPLLYGLQSKEYLFMLFLVLIISTCRLNLLIFPFALWRKTEAGGNLEG